MFCVDGTASDDAGRVTVVVMLHLYSESWFQLQNRDDVHDQFLGSKITRVSRG